MTKTTATRPKNLSERDREDLEKVRELLGPEPRRVGFARNLFQGHLREDLLLPYPEEEDESERRRCDRLLAELDRYLREEHPHHAIDVEQRIPEEAIRRLFELGVMGMVIPVEYGGGGFGFRSYCRVLERIGRTCESTSVLVSAHESIGCYGMLLFGNDEQKRQFLPRLATDTIGAFCLSEPNVGSDAGGQETRCELSPDGSHYVLNGEKKWATSAAYAGVWTVMAKQRVTHPRTGKEADRVTALVVTPDLDGVEVFSPNRSKCGIRGTWQARIRFHDVHVPRENLLYKEGEGLKIALTCLDYGRCSLAAGIVGAAGMARDQAIKWSQYRYQFGRPIGEFERIEAKIADMEAWGYALDAMLTTTAGLIDRKAEDIMLETAMCKVFASEMGFRTVDETLQIMGGEGYMTENVIERLWRDSRIYIIVEGANEVMQSFIFGYGAEHFGEDLRVLKDRPFRHPIAGLRVGAEIFLGMKRRAPRLEGAAPALARPANELEVLVRDFSHAVLKSLYRHGEGVLTRQMVHARLGHAAVWLYAISCSIAKADASVRKRGNLSDDESAVLDHLVSLGTTEIRRAFAALDVNSDETRPRAANAARARASQLPNSDFAIPERTPDESARGTGRRPDVDNVPQFEAAARSGRE